jgi:hypothetical protein
MSKTPNGPKSAAEYGITIADGPVYARSGFQTADGMTVLAVRTQITGYRLPVDAPVVVLPDPSYAPFAAPDDALGAYHGGQVYLFARGCARPPRSRSRCSMSSWAIHGLRGAFGPELDAVLRSCGATTRTSGRKRRAGWTGSARTRSSSAWMPA